MGRFDEDSEHSQRWYVAETARGKEQFAVDNLVRQSFRSVCLRFRKTRRHARRVDEILAPLFPGYVFVQFAEGQDRWSAINGTLGVKRLVGSHNCRPVPIPGAVIGALFARCEGNIVKDSASALQQGQRVQIIAGPLADQWGTVEKLAENERVRVLLDFLGRDTLTTLRVSALAPA